ncbi:MAG: carbon-nitrogen hydrolase family protein [Gaiellaceae bacterium]|jgi:predicted amidohydrolase
MSSLTVSLLQLRSPGPDPERALREGERACREAARLGADVALFPEMWQIGYAWWDDFGQAREMYAALATETDGPFVGHFRELARELGMAIVITYLQRTAVGPRNAATVIDRRGNSILTYAKVHTCDFSLEGELTPGAEFPVADLELAQDSVRIGVMICYDREFPEAARVLMLGGAEIILTPNACPLGADRIGQFRARAFENMVGVAMTNYAGPVALEPHAHDECNGHSVVFSGICFDDLGRPRDHTLVEADESEGIFLASFDLDELRSYRKRQTWGDAYRKPHAYRAITTDAPAPIFRRSDSRRAP